MVISAMSLSAVSEIAMVPDSACSTPTLMVSAACTDMAESPCRDRCGSGRVWRGKRRGVVKAPGVRLNAPAIGRQRSAHPLCKPYATLTKAALHQSGATNNNRRQTSTRFTTPRTNETCNRRSCRPCGTTFKQAHAALCTKGSTGTAFAKDGGKPRCCFWHRCPTLPWSFLPAFHLHPPPRQQPRAGPSQHLERKKLWN